MITMISDGMGVPDGVPLVVCVWGGGGGGGGGGTSYQNMTEYRLAS